MADYLEGLSDEVKRAREHAKWVANGSRGVPFHGDFAGTPLSTLQRLEWWIREIKRERDELIHKPRKGVSDLREEANYLNFKSKMIKLLERIVDQKRCHGSGDPDHVWCDANELLKELLKEA